MTKEIKVIDYPMGTGKTKYIRQYMTENPHKRYIYVTPLLSEAEKMADACASIGMITPENSESTKTEMFLDLLTSGENISTTHSLFKAVRDKHIKLIESWKYTIIIDETVDFIESYTDYTNGDIKDLLERGDLTVDENSNGRVSMHWEVSDDNKYANLRDMCNAGLIYSTKLPAVMLNVQVPPRMLTAANEVIVMTYLYEYSFMHKFMQIHGFTYTKIKLQELEDELPKVKHKIKNNLEIIELKALDALLKNQRETALSHSWWNTQLIKDTTHIKNIFKMCSNWLNNNKEHSDKFFFTCPKILVSKEGTGKRLTKSVLESASIPYFTSLLGVKKVTEVNDGDTTVKVTSLENIKWLYSGTKATNEYADKTMCFYLINAYPNVGVAHYLKDFGTEMNNDEFALSEMIQFIWRGNIRVPDGKMKVYLGSNRMKTLLKNWIDFI